MASTSYRSPAHAACCGWCARANRAGPVRDSYPTPAGAAAEQRLAETADKTELSDRAETNTRSFVQGLFAGAGYKNVTVVFDQPGSAAAS